MSTNKNVIENIISMPVKGRKENQTASLEFLKGIESISDLAMKTAAAAAIFGSNNRQEDLSYWSQGFISKAYLNGSEENGPVKQVDELPGHVLDSEAFKDSFYSLPLTDEDKLEQIKSALLGANPSRLQHLFVNSIRWDKPTIVRLCEVSEDVKNLVFDSSALEQIKVLEDKERETLALQEWFAQFTVDGQAQVFKERSVRGTLNKMNSEKVIKFIEANKFNKAVFDLGKERTINKAWSALNGQGLALRTYFIESKSTDEEGNEIVKKMLRNDMLLVIPEGFTLPESL